MRACILSILASLALTSAAAAQPTAFTYQGRLKNGAALATGLHDFRFTLFNVVSGGVQLATPQCVDNILVTEGLFTATLDFGQQFVTTSALFLQVEVRADTGLTCANPAGLILLGPRQPLTATPTASHAKSAFSLAAADGSPQQAVFVDNAGNVGIGTTAPLCNLHVMASGQGVRLQGQSAGVNNSCYIGFANGAGTDLGYLGDGSSGDNNMYLTCYTGDVYLYTASGAAVSAKPSGNVGIGTASPAAKLDVRGNIRLGSSGQYSAVGGVEDLRLVRGDIDGNGTLIRGSGLSVSRNQEGVYDITFTPQFSGVPTIVVMVDQTLTSAQRRWPTSSQSFLSTSTARILIMNEADNYTDSDWSICVIGPR